MAFANLGISTPVFVLGLLLAFLFAIVLKGTPVRAAAIRAPEPGRAGQAAGRRSGASRACRACRARSSTSSPDIYTFTALITFQWNAFVDAFRHLILPAIALGTIPMAIIARITRSSLLDVMGRDYVRTARAKGARRLGRAARATRCATRCCRSSPSSGSRSASCWAARC